MTEVRRPKQKRKIPAGERQARPIGQRRPWPVKMLTWLLLFQGVGLLAIGLYHVDLRAGLQTILQETSFFAALPALGVLALVAAAGFFYPRPGAWVIAMLVQGLNLLATLLFYFRYRTDNFFLYAIMVYAVVMVVYLNYAQVPGVFRRTAPLVMEEADDE